MRKMVKKMINIIPILPLILMSYLSYRLGMAIGREEAEDKFRHELFHKYLDTPSIQVKRD